MSGEWQVAVRKGRRKAMQPTVQTLLPCVTENWNRMQSEGCAHTVHAVHERPLVAQFAEGTAALRCLQTKIEACSKEVLQSSFYNSFKRLLEYVQRQNLMDNTFEQCKSQNTFCWEDATELVIYGLGSPAAGSRPVHCQLAFLVLLQSLLPSLQHTRAFDPVFTSTDIALLQSLNIEVLKENNSGKYAVGGTTVFYMPHCDCHLYNNVLTANWSPQQLCKIAILGNSFHAYAQRWAQPSKLSHAERPHKLLAVSAPGTAVELPVNEADFPVTSAFNDLSLHLFPEWKMGDQDWLCKGTTAGHIRRSQAIKAQHCADSQHQDGQQAASKDQLSRCCKKQSIHQSSQDANWPASVLHTNCASMQSAQKVTSCANFWPA